MQKKMSKGVIVVTLDDSSRLRRRLGRYAVPVGVLILVGAGAIALEMESPSILLQSRSDHVEKEMVGAGAIALEMESTSILLQSRSDHVEKETPISKGSERITPELEEIHEWNFPAKPSNGTFYRKRSQMSYEFNSAVQFIFTIGLEGTGHHLMGGVAASSPAIQRLKNIHVWNEEVGSLQNFLFSHLDTKKDPNRRAGIWNAHCAANQAASKLEQEIVKKMIDIEKKARGMLKNNSSQRFPLPLNTAKAKGSLAYGEVSYPNYRGECRSLNYPDLNLLYNACRKAKVDCMHVFLQRHPLEILRSVVRRGFSQNDTSSMQMYIVDLHVLANQMRMHASKTLGCFSLFSEDPNDLLWIDAQRDLWAWSNAKLHKSFMDSIYKKPEHSNFTNEQHFQEWITTSEHAPYVQSWWNVHQHAIETCRQTVKDLAT